MGSSYLVDLLTYLTAAIVIVPIFRFLGLGAVLGYLAAGCVIGPWGLKLIVDVENILHFAEFGVVLLLFIIGLELKPSRLWALRKSVFGLGATQVLLTTFSLTGVAMLMGFEFSIAMVGALGLSLSSTAFALQILAEKNQLNTAHGRTSFSILLFQDLAVIPILAIIPLMASDPEQGAGTATDYVTTFGVIFSVILGGRFLLRHLFRAIAYARVKEIFTAASLLLVIGMALLMQKLGLSMALGSFLAGVLLADSEYRHELEANIEPFKGLLLGLFFIAVGMSVDFGLIEEKPGAIIVLTLGLLAVKAIVLFGIGKFSGLQTESARNLSFVLPQGGEFAFVIYSVATQSQLLPGELADLLVVVVTLSMALTPLLFGFNQKYLKKFSELSERPFDAMPTTGNKVIIAGFGRFGQIISRLLRTEKIEFTALEHNPEQVDIARKYGALIYYGDASRLDLIEAAGAKNAELFVLAIDEVEASLATAAMVRKHFPDLKIIARCRNREHAFRLMDLGVKTVFRETYGSALEAAESTLTTIGVSQERASRIVRTFRTHDEQVLEQQYAIHHNEAELISYTKKASQQLEDLLAADEKAHNFNYLDSNQIKVSTHFPAPAQMTQLQRK